MEETPVRARPAPARVIVMTRVAAPQALVLVEDSAGGEPPPAVPGQLASATATSVAVGCAGATATDIRLGDLALVPFGPALAAFDGRLATPSRKVAVRTLLGATLLEVTVPTTETQVRIWANDPAEPTELTIAVARAASGVAR
jgi:hypothetical protein